jgi:hypothetical protein
MEFVHGCFRQPAPQNDFWLNTRAVAARELWRFSVNGAAKLPAQIDGHVIPPLPPMSATTNHWNSVEK